jgi:hypothetical protein
LADGGRRSARRRRVDALGDALQPLPTLRRRNARRGNCEASEGGVGEGERHAQL